jgi:hypothetical protein
MSVEQHQQSLLATFEGSNDPAVRGSANIANHYTELFKTGQISKEEYLQLMEDISHSNNINKNMENLALMEQMNVAINGLISLAKLV